MIPVKNLFIVLSLFFLLGSADPSFSGSVQRMSPQKAKKRLLKGNARYRSDQNQHVGLNEARRILTTEKGQHPFATIIACSDSRVPVEAIFDQGIGDIFVIRVAGNVCGVLEIASIEYGVDHLNTPLMVVLGHTHCGAVTAAVTAPEVHRSIPALLDKIKPAVEKARKSNPELKDQALVPEAVKTNVWQSIEDLLTNSEAVRERIKDKRLKVMGAVYDIATGYVSWLGSHPEQDRLLKSTGGH